MQEAQSNTRHLKTETFLLSGSWRGSGRDSMLQLAVPGYSVGWCCRSFHDPEFFLSLAPHERQEALYLASCIGHILVPSLVVCNYSCLF